MMQTTTPAATRLDAELDDVLRWRFDQLCRAGYDEDAAVELATRVRVDLHLAARLLRERCPVPTALRILL